MGQIRWIISSRPVPRPAAEFHTSLTLGLHLWCEIASHGDGFVDDVLGPARTLGVVSQRLHRHPQLVADGSAVGVPPGGVPDLPEAVNISEPWLKS